MVLDAIQRWRGKAEAYFPERHIYVRAEGSVRTLVLTSERQMMIAATCAALLLWLALGSSAMLWTLLSGGRGDQETIRTQARYERLIADRDARLNSALAQLNETGSSIEALAQSTEHRHEALVMLLTGAHGDTGLAKALTPASTAAFAGRSPADSVNAVRADQDRLINEAETYAKSRAERLRLAYRLAGLDPAAFDRSDGDALGGPLIEAKDPRALAAVLDVDDDTDD